MPPKPTALPAPITPPTMMFAANQAQAEEAVREARSMFGRTLATWASDLLSLQSRGLHIASWDSSSAMAETAAFDEPQTLRKAA